jgi:chloramphenicol-sensitive protein RarD
VIIKSQSIIANPAKRSLPGLVYVLLTFSFWGFVPVYWKIVVFVPPPQLVAQRIIWSLILLAFFFCSSAKIKSLMGTSKDKRKIGWLCFNNVVPERQLARFSAVHLVAFALIWASLAIYITDLLMPLRVRSKLEK